jgi:undecaprenyl-diphosphatase
VPSSLTIFAASSLVYIDAFCALIVVAALLYRRPRPDWLRWAIAIIVTAVIAFILAKIGGAVYNDPRPFTQDHVKPLISHAADNGFPSDHALLAAVIVAAILLVSPLWVAPFVLLAVLVDWARVGAGIHHFADVVGSSLFVAVGLVVALVVAPPLSRLLARYVPVSWLGEPERISQ